MRSRIAITLLLASGALMSSGGAALGVSALSTTTHASQAQYGPVETTTTTSQTSLGPSGNTLAAEDQVTRPDGARKDSTDDPTATAQPARQLEAGDGDELPFTGYAAIPLLLVGLLLLVSGLVLRRSTSTDSSQVT